MVRKLLCGFLALAVFTGILLAEEVKGKFKKYEKGTLTVTVKDKDETFKLSKDSKVYNGDDEVKGKERRFGMARPGRGQQHDVQSLRLVGAGRMRRVEGRVEQEPEILEQPQPHGPPPRFRRRMTLRRGAARVTEKAVLGEDG